MRFVTLLLILLSTQVLYSQIDSVKVKSKVTDVTVFFSGAQVTRKAEVKLNKGKYLLILESLPKEINPNSIQVNNINNCKILAVKHNTGSTNETQKSKEELSLENKISLNEYKIKQIKNKINVYEIEEKMLLENSNLKGKEGGGVISEIKEAADFYRLRLNGIRTDKLNLFNDLDSANAEIKRLYLKLNKITSSKRLQYSSISISVECEKQTASELAVSYYIASAGWEALYDFRVDDIGSPLNIVYNANVFQSSGEDWKNVNLTLSTNNPSLSGVKPELSTWYLDRRSNITANNASNESSTLIGKVFDASSGEPLPFANIELSTGNTLVKTSLSDFNGGYSLKPLKSGYYSAKVSYVGYTTSQINNIWLRPGRITFVDFELKPSAINLENVVITDYKVPLIDKDGGSSAFATTIGGAYSHDGQLGSLRGQRSEGEVIYIDGVRVKGKNEIESFDYISNTIKTSVTNMEYVIEIPYTIPSDGSDYSIRIKEVNLPVNYVYYAVPKLETDVFLTAEITDWSQLNLISGKAGIYYQGTFTGESYINVNELSDTLSLSLGRDRNILVKREGNKEVINKQVIGNNIRETVGWNITIRNNKSATINIVVEDQFPISENKSVVIDRIETANAIVDDKTGKMVWKFELAPNDKKILSYKYSVKYPKYVKLFME